jgi:uncharacterized protein with GYD domain
VSFATLGRFDVVDIVEANDPKEIETRQSSSGLTAISEISP